MLRKMAILRKILLPIDHVPSKEARAVRKPRINLVIVGWMILASAVLAGCNRGGDTPQATPAAVNGPGGQNAAPADPSTPPAQPEQDTSHPVVAIDTTLGSFTVRLDGDKVPMTVDNFISYVNSHHFDQTIFHQVSKERPKVILGGAFTAQLTEKKPNMAIYNEAPKGRKNLRGTIGMARQPDVIHSATCHFYVNLTDNPQLDYKDSTIEGYGYCVFGEVIEGLDVVERIGQVAVRDNDKFLQIPVDTVAITAVRRVK
jgi:cyclophilin family peptidyl-prolyl cis-trans isomerase